MNAIDQVSAAASPDRARSAGTAAERSPAGLLRALTLAFSAASAALLTAFLCPLPALAPLHQGRTAAVDLMALLLPMTGLAGAWLIAWGRRRAELPPLPPPMRRWRRLLSVAGRGDPTLVSRTARWPQMLLITALSATVLATGWLLPAGPSNSVVVPAANFVTGAAMLVLAFPMLVVERLFAAMATAGNPAVTRLPEVDALRSLLLLPVIAWPATGLVLIATGLGVSFAGWIDTVIVALLMAVAAELCLRAVGRCFLPPPTPDTAKAAIDSVLVRIIADGISTRGLAEPVRQHLGIDFSRSWALSYLRSAAPPVALFLLLLCWALSGVVLVGMDQRAVYERFGAPVAVLHPGLHTILPWPMGQVRWVEFGTVHDIALIEAGASLPAQRVAAEDKPPPDADRLWEKAHPAEVMFLIAGHSGTSQSFQVVSADIKIRYQIGLTDEDAVHLVYHVADPAAALRGSAERRVAAFLAGRTLDQVLGENREEMAERLRTALQQDLDRIDCGIRLAAVVIEAIHPPAGAAEAYHNVQAAQILAVSSIAAEQGSAVAVRAKASQYGTDLTTQAGAAAAEQIGAARDALIRFTADHTSAIADAGSFLLERRLTAIATGLPKALLTIIDHRIPEADAPTIDLRPLSPATSLSAGHDQE